LIALVVDPAQLEIRTTVDEIDVLKVRVGQEVRLSLESLQGLSQEDLSALLGALQGAGAGQGSGATPPQGRGAFGGQPPSGFVPGQGPGPGGAPSGRPPFAGGRQGQQTDGTPAATPQATGTPSSGQTPAPVGTAAAPGGLGQRAGGQAGRPAAGLRGQVSKVDVLATRTQGVVTYGITISVSTPPGVTLREGLTTVASIITESKENVLVVPNRAIRTQSGQRFVTVSLPDGKTEQRAVRVGSTDGQSTEILDGLQEGDKVIVSTATRSGTTGGQGQLGIPFGGGPGGPPPGGFR
ncbi:MAG: hypothetical protein HYX97_03900, partial [Chloroflexi bacterium]|nr:hypothetical protein [Chloroflexota bacterium]